MVARYLFFICSNLRHTFLAIIIMYLYVLRYFYGLLTLISPWELSRVRVDVKRVI